MNLTATKRRNRLSVEKLCCIYIYEFTRACSSAQATNIHLLDNDLLARTNTSAGTQSPNQLIRSISLRPQLLVDTSPQLDEKAKSHLLFQPVEGEIQLCRPHAYYWGSPYPQAVSTKSRLFYSFRWRHQQDENLLRQRESYRTYEQGVNKTSDLPSPTLAVRACATRRYRHQMDPYEGYASRRTNEILGTPVLCAYCVYAISELYWTYRVDGMKGNRKSLFLFSTYWALLRARGVCQMMIGQNVFSLLTCPLETPHLLDYLLSTPLIFLFSSLPSCHHKLPSYSQSLPNVSLGELFAFSGMAGLTTYGSQLQIHGPKK
jgi:hypothetical protein